jgi:hypothetical protein
MDRILNIANVHCIGGIKQSYYEAKIQIVLTKKFKIIRPFFIPSVDRFQTKHLARFPSIYRVVLDYTFAKS